MIVNPLTLAQIELFSLLPDDICERISLLIDDLEYQDGQIIMHEGERNPPVYFVSAGTVRFYQSYLSGDEQNLYFILAGNCLNLTSPFVRQYSAPATAAALGSVNLLSISRENFSKITGENLPFALAVIHKISENIHHIPIYTMNSGLTSVRARLADFLFNICGNQPQKELNLSTKDIARHTGLTQNMVRRTMRAFRQEGIIIEENSGVRILDRDKLKTNFAN